MKGEYLNLKADIKIALKYSFGLTLCFVILFAIGKLTGFVKVIELRYFNYVFTTIFCYMAMNEVYRGHKYGSLFYAQTLISILTATFGQFWFCILFFIYLNIDSALATYFLSKEPWDIIVPKFSLAILLFAEGVGMSAIIALFLPQYFDWRKKEVLTTTS